jgi:hypothetical protein
MILSCSERPIYCVEVALLLIGDNFGQRRALTEALAAGVKSENGRKFAGQKNVLSMADYFFMSPQGAVLSHKQKKIQGKASALCCFAVLICAACVKLSRYKTQVM